MSHDRGCFCGRERWEYDDCPDSNCHKKELKVDKLVQQCLDKAKGPMTLNEYQEAAYATAVYPDAFNILYPAVKLASEAGEAVGVVGKFLRGDYGFEEMKRQLRKELGDVLWYVAAVAEDLGVSLQIIAEENLEKLQDRKERGVLKGSGDNR